METKLFTTGEAARLLGVTPSRVCALKKAGALVPVASTVSGKPLFDAPMVESFAARRRARVMFSSP